MSHLYVVEFSSGHIKVGRSIHPESRIAQHEARVACLGISVEVWSTFSCISDVVRAEAGLIQWCVSNCTKRTHAEWFEGLDFQAVTSIAKSYSLTRFAQDVSNADAHLISFLGGPARVAELLNLQGAGGTQRVHNWIERGIPAKVKLDHPHIFLKHLMPRAASEASATA